MSKRVKMLENKWVKGELRKAGDVVDLDDADYDLFKHRRRGRDPMFEPYKGPIAADARGEGDERPDKEPSDDADAGEAGEQEAAAEEAQTGSRRRARPRSQKAS